MARRRIPCVRMAAFGVIDRLAELPTVAAEAMIWADQQWRTFIARWNTHVHVERWLLSDELALRSPVGEPPPFPYLARVEGCTPGIRPTRA